MAHMVQVILLENIDSLGRAGDIVSVAEGYARNALFPTGKAALATESVRKESAQKKKAQKQSRVQQLEVVQKKAEELDGTQLVIETRVKEGDEIYGSVNKKQILGELKKQAGISKEIKRIDVQDGIKKLGTYDLKVLFDEGVECIIKLVIAPDEESKKLLEHQ